MFNCVLMLRLQWKKKNWSCLMDGRKEIQWVLILARLYGIEIVNSQVAVRELINHILNTTDMTIALTPHVIEDGNNDYEVLYKYYQEFKDTGRVILLPDNLNAIQYKGYIARMRFFIGARTHATIAAYSSFIPTMVLGYSVKSKGISKDIFGEEKLVLDIEEISDSNKLKARFDEMVREEEEIRQKLRQSIPNVKKMSYKAVEYLKELSN